MVQLQLSSLDQLEDSCFGRPFPRHGLQLLFWFANDCVTVESANVMKLVSDCQPENGLFGFHVFGNIEELLPALKKRRNKKQVSYFEVGNLNTETYPASADLPAYVRENYGLDGNYGDDNSDRIIISYRARSRLVEAVYVTEHDADAFGRFRADRTFQIHRDLIRVLQDQRLDVSSLLRQMGYYDDVQQPAVQEVREVLDVLQTFSRDAFFTEPFSFDRRWTFNTTSSRTLKPRKTRTKKKTRAVTSSYWEPDWDYRYPVYAEEPKRKDGGRGGGGRGLGLIRILLAAGALYLAFRCFRRFRCFWRWMRSCWESQSVLTVNPWRAEGRRPPHAMLDYVF